MMPKANRKRRKSGESGQALPIVALAMTGLLGMTGLAVDVGMAYVAQRQLQAATDAAALAGAQQLPNATYSSAAQQYSAAQGGYNTYNSLQNVSFSVTPKCLTSVAAACLSPANANAVQVVETAQLSTYFARAVNFSAFAIKAVATAAAKSGPAQFNVAVVLDTTDSMTLIDSDATCASTRVSCALQGVRVLLQGLIPCRPTDTSCGAVSNGNVSDPYDGVSLFVFPGITSVAAVPTEYCGSGATIQISPYTAAPLPQYAIGPVSGGTVVNFSTDYKGSNSTTTLNGNSDLVQAVGGGTCTGVKVIGGVGTFFAGAITAAQAALATAKAANPSAASVMILLSDGDAFSPPPDLIGYPASNPGQCTQAITAAATAKNAGTSIYSVAYGSDALNLCSYGTQFVDTVTPCQTMQEIATDNNHFFSDWTANYQGASQNCVSSARPISGLSTIFNAILHDLGTASLIPDNSP